MTASSASWVASAWGRETVSLPALSTFDVSLTPPDECGRPSDRTRRLIVETPLELCHMATIRWVDGLRMIPIRAQID